MVMSVKHIRVAMLALLLLAGASAAAAQVPSADAESEFCLDGVIVEEANREPVRGISVVVTVANRDHVAATDSLGGYRICALPQGQYIARAVRIGFYPEEREIWLDCFDVARVFNSSGELISGCLHEAKLNFYMRRPGPNILPPAADNSLGMPAPPPNNGLQGTPSGGVIASSGAGACSAPLNLGR